MRHRETETQKLPLAANTKTSTNLQPDCCMGRGLARRREGAKNKSFFCFVPKPNVGRLLRGFAASREKMQFAQQKKRSQPAPKAGFTLMEVNIALLIMAVGLMGLLALFPVGLRQGDSATSDTTEAAFADLVLNAMRANAQMVTNWTDWTALTNSVNLGVAGTAPATGGQIVYADGTTMIHASRTNIDNYLGTGQHIEYVLTVANGSSALIKTASIQITNRRYTDLSTAPMYATSFVFMGM